MKFQKIGRKSSFGVPIVLDHLVSENMSLSGHFDVFTTHTTVFSSLSGHSDEQSKSPQNAEILTEISPNGQNV